MVAHPLDPAETTGKTMLDTLDMGAPISRVHLDFTSAHMSRFHFERRVGSAVALASELLSAAPPSWSTAKAELLFNGGDCSRRLTPSTAKIRGRAYLALLPLRGPPALHGRWSWLSQDSRFVGKTFRRWHLHATLQVAGSPSERSLPRAG
jgi:hypothetical protein